MIFFSTEDENHDISIAMLSSHANPAWMKYVLSPSGRIQIFRSVLDLRHLYI